ncbi:lauroyl-Kdo(2)-lipid IV(A) myristoyltransferase [Vibrio ulleungensis]|uniref:Lipid A biosynthesis acyltransferase n=1 Tax=Vibrio ulleungensis TaxID=2807619 RepID=A0ABS2HJH7_9VIBR|nr:lauroyl-Kdo(2)-lipid IV(A) myristoyltransferase [Vibrio ulleungensis]MBM7037670.1 lauroyl-Kdo(2)-lipid IV(A) myristoyltransferase [Vibrio ulleungensis]
MTQRNDFDPKAYNPTFQWRFFAPKYWGVWLALIVGIPVALLPRKWHLKLATIIANHFHKKERGPAHRARVNLHLCFPEKSYEEREEIIRQTFITAVSFLLSFPALTLKNKQWLAKNTTVSGLENITQATDNGDNVILLVPHTFAIDIPAILLASKGMPVSAMAKKQKNEVADWLMHRQRVQYGGRVYERSGGIKPFIKSIKEGYLGYYLPDQDHGPEHSIFVDFFATTKATLPGLGKLSKVSRAKIVPVYSMYNAQLGRYEIKIEPAFSPFPTDTEEGDARAMNGFIERNATARPEQYMWVLQLLHSQQSGKDLYVELNDLFYPR